MGITVNVVDPDVFATQAARDQVITAVAGVAGVSTGSVDVMRVTDSSTGAVIYLNPAYAGRFDSPTPTPTPTTSPTPTPSSAAVVGEKGASGSRRALLESTVRRRPGAGYRSAASVHTAAIARHRVLAARGTAIIDTIIKTTGVNQASSIGSSITSNTATFASTVLAVLKAVSPTIFASSSIDVQVQSAPSLAQPSFYLPSLASVLSGIDLRTSPSFVNRRLLVKQRSGVRDLTALDAPLASYLTNAAIPAAVQANAVTAIGNGTAIGRNVTTLTPDKIAAYLSSLLGSPGKQPSIPAIGAGSAAMVTDAADTVILTSSLFATSTSAAPTISALSVPQLSAWSSYLVPSLVQYLDLGVNATAALGTAAANTTKAWASQQKALPLPQSTLDFLSSLGNGTFAPLVGAKLRISSITWTITGYPTSVIRTSRGWADPVNASTVTGLHTLTHVIDMSSSTLADATSITIQPGTLRPGFVYTIAASGSATATWDTAASALADPTLNLNVDTAGGTSSPLTLSQAFIRAGVFLNGLDQSVSVPLLIGSPLVLYCQLPPWQGAVAVAPSTGTALLTRFNVSTAGWQDDAAMMVPVADKRVAAAVLAAWVPSSAVLTNWLVLDRLQSSTAPAIPIAASSTSSCVSVTSSTRPIDSLWYRASAYAAAAGATINSLCSSQSSILSRARAAWPFNSTALPSSTTTTSRLTLRMSTPVDVGLSSAAAAAANITASLPPSSPSADSDLVAAGQLTLQVLSGFLGAEMAPLQSLTLTSNSALTVSGTPFVGTSSANDSVVTILAYCVDDEGAVGWSSSIVQLSSPLSATQARDPAAVSSFAATVAADLLAGTGADETNGTSSSSGSLGSSLGPVLRMAAVQQVAGFMAAVSSGDTYASANISDAAKSEIIAVNTDVRERLASVIARAVTSVSASSGAAVYANVTSTAGLSTEQLTTPPADDSTVSIATKALQSTTTVSGEVSNNTRSTTLSAMETLIPLTIPIGSRIQENAAAAGASSSSGNASSTGGNLTSSASTGSSLDVKAPSLPPTVGDVVLGVLVNVISSELLDVEAQATASATANGTSSRRRRQLATGDGSGSDGSSHFGRAASSVAPTADTSGRVSNLLQVLAAGLLRGSSAGDDAVSVSAGPGDAFADSAGDSSAGYCGPALSMTAASVDTGSSTTSEEGTDDAAVITLARPLAPCRSSDNDTSVPLAQPRVSLPISRLTDAKRADARLGVGATVTLVQNGVTPYAESSGLMELAYSKPVAEIVASDASASNSNGTDGAGGLISAASSIVRNTALAALSSLGLTSGSSTAPVADLDPTHGLDTRVTSVSVLTSTGSAVSIKGNASSDSSNGARRLSGQDSSASGHVIDTTVGTSIANAASSPILIEIPLADNSATVGATLNASISSWATTINVTCPIPTGMLVSDDNRYYSSTIDGGSSALNITGWHLRYPAINDTLDATTLDNGTHIIFQLPMAVRIASIDAVGYAATVSRSLSFTPDFSSVSANAAASSLLDSSSSASSAPPFQVFCGRTLYGDVTGASGDDGTAQTVATSSILSASAGDGNNTSEAYAAVASVDVSAIVRSPGEAITIQPVFSLEYDCGGPIGVQTFTCGPGYYGREISYTCPDVIRRPTCLYWDATANAWSGQGCVVQSVSDTSITCACDHLTAFAARYAALAQQQEDMFALTSELANECVVGYNAYIFEIVGAMAAIVIFGTCAARGVDIRGDKKFYKSLMADEEITFMRMLSIQRKAAMDASAAAAAPSQQPSSLDKDIDPKIAAARAAASRKAKRIADQPLDFILDRMYDGHHEGRRTMFLFCMCNRNRGVRATNARKASSNSASNLSTRNLGTSSSGDALALIKANPLAKALEAASAGSAAGDAQLTAASSSSIADAASIHNIVAGSGGPSAPGDIDHKAYAQVYLSQGARRARLLAMAAASKKGPSATAQTRSSASSRSTGPAVTALGSAKQGGSVKASAANLDVASSLALEDIALHTSKPNPYASAMYVLLVQQFDASRVTADNAMLGNSSTSAMMAMALSTSKRNPAISSAAASSSDQGLNGTHAAGITALLNLQQALVSGSGDHDSSDDDDSVVDSTGSALAITKPAAPVRPPPPFSRVASNHQLRLQRTRSTGSSATISRDSAAPTARGFSDRLASGADGPQFSAAPTGHGLLHQDNTDAAASPSLDLASGAAAVNVDEFTEHGDSTVVPADGAVVDVGDAHGSTRSLPSPQAAEWSPLSSPAALAAEMGVAVKPSAGGTAGQLQSSSSSSRLSADSKKVRRIAASPTVSPRSHMFKNPMALAAMKAKAAMGGGSDGASSPRTKALSSPPSQSVKRSARSLAHSSLAVAQAAASMLQAAAASGNKKLKATASKMMRLEDEDLKERLATTVQTAGEELKEPSRWSLVRMWRMRGFLVHVWCLRVRFASPIFSLWSKYDPRLPRPARLSALMIELITSLWASLFLFGWTQGYDSDLSDMDFSELFVTSVLAALLQAPITGFVHACVLVACESEWVWRYPLINAELERRKAAAAGYRKMTLAELQQKRTELQAKLQILQGGASKQASSSSTALVPAAPENAPASDALQLAEVPSSAAPASITPPAAGTATQPASTSTPASTPTPPASSSASESAAGWTPPPKQPSMPTSEAEINAAAAQYGWVDAPTDLLACCSCILRCCGRHPSQKKNFVAAQWLKQSKASARARKHTRKHGRRAHASTATAAAAGALVAVAGAVKSSEPADTTQATGTELALVEGAAAGAAAGPEDVNVALATAAGATVGSSSAAVPAEDTAAEDEAEEGVEEGGGAEGDEDEEEREKEAEELEERWMDMLDELGEAGDIGEQIFVLLKGFVVIVIVTRIAKLCGCCRRDKEKSETHHGASSAAAVAGTAAVPQQTAQQNNRLRWLSRFCEQFGTCAKHAYASKRGMHAIKSSQQASGRSLVKKGKELHMMSDAELLAASDDSFRRWGLPCTKASFFLYLFVAAWSAFVLYYVVLFGVWQPKEIVLAALAAWALTIGWSFCLFQPFLFLSSVLWSFAVWPAWQPYLAWIPRLGAVLAPTPAPAALGADASTKGSGVSGKLLTGRLENVTLIRAAGEASRLSPDSAVVAYGATAVVSALISSVTGSVRRAAAGKAKPTEPAEVESAQTIQEKQQLAIQLYALQRMVQAMDAGSTV